MQSLRWLASRDGRLGVIPTNSFSTVGDAGKFLLHGAAYMSIADFHISMNRGLVTPVVDPEALSVRFVHSSEESFDGSIYGFLEHTKDARNWLKGRLTSSNDVESRAIELIQSLPHSLVDGRIVINEPRQLCSLITASECRSPDDEQIPRDAVLPGFTPQDYDAFWRGLRAWSIAAQGLYLMHVMKSVPQNQCMPTQCVQFGKFVSGMAGLTGLTESSIDSILRLLTFDRANSRADIHLQPFLVDQETVCWSPSFVSVLRQERNLLKLLSRVASTKEVADNIIGSRHRSLLRRIGNRLSEHGYSYKLETSVSAGGESGDIDLLGWKSGAPNEVLLVEGKALLAPDEINEVDEATTKLQSGQDQIRKVTKILSTMMAEEKRVLFPFVPWSNVTSMHGAVISREALPNARYDNSEIPASSIGILRTRIRPSQFKSPSRLVNALIVRPWLKENELQYEEIYTAIKIGEVTYELPTRRWVREQ